MAWTTLFVAGLFECVWAIGMKYADGFTRLWPSAITLVAIGASMYLLAIAIKDIPIGTAYAVWTGIGAVGVALMGILLFDESTAVLRLLCIALIVVGIVGLKLLDGAGV